MAFNYNNEVIDLLFKKTLGTTYTTSNLVPGQEVPLQPKKYIMNKYMGVHYPMMIQVCLNGEMLKM